MIDINAMRAMVNKMGPDEAGMEKLRQFARQYHDNSIAMSLVSSRLTDIQRAKQIEAAKRIPAEPNTIIDQVAQSIPMEESGIAALPVNNMAMAANGGIVGYSGKDDEQLVDEGGGSDEVYDPAGNVSSSGGSDFSVKSFLEKLGIGNAKNRATLDDIADFKLRQAAGKLTDDEKRKLGMPVAAKPTEGERQTNSTRPGVVQPVVVNREPAAAPAARLAPAMNLAAAPTTQGVIDQFKAFQDSIGAPSYSSITAEQEKVNALAKKAAEDSKAATENYYAKRGDAFKGKDERLAAREAALEKTKSSIEGMAWIQAGLETMGTSGSLAQAISAGGKKGMESYGSGIKNYTDSKERLDDARDKLDDLRTNYKDMSEKEIMAATRDINTVVVNGSQAMVTLLREQAKNGDQKSVDLLKVYDEQLRRNQEAQLRKAEMEQKERHYNNPKVASTDTERLMKQLSALRAQGKIKEADELLKTFQDVKGIGQREDAVSARIEAKKQEKLASDPMYKRALRILADPNATPEDKTKAERDRLTSLLAASLESGTTMTPNAPPPDAVREVKK